jgi:hypothetical protein
MMSTASRWLFISVGAGAVLWLAWLGAALWIVFGDEARADLREDWGAIRGRSAIGWVRVGVETVLSLGLLVRACLHTVVYLTSGLGGRPSVTLGLKWSPLSGRPRWNEWTARLFTAICGLWLIQSMHLGWGWPPLVEQALRIVFAANAAVLVSDPVVGAAQRLFRSDMSNTTRRTDGEQHG